jgi:hypothetical protein
MKGCLATIGGVVVVLVGLAMCMGSNMSSSFNPASHERNAVSTETSDSACDTANKREIQAADYINNDEYQKAYDTAISGLHYVELCDNDDDNLLNKGYLLSFKALAEHHLSSGDSATDLNEANALLVECQTHPGFYGTHVGAQCETQENNNIRTQTNWEMQNY